jgi:predicted nucleic acid-binding protein
MPTGKIRYCWDSCVFISLLTGQGRTDEDMSNLRKVERLVDDGDVVVFTPAITFVEVLECYLTESQEAAFRALLRRSNVQPVSVNMRVAEKAREVRNYYRVRGLEIAVPDSIHIGTALHYGATALHTYDGCGKRQRKNDLLKLETPLIEKYHLKICKPEPPPAELKKVSEESQAAPPRESMSLFGELEEVE